MLTPRPSRLTQVHLIAASALILGVIVYLLLSLWIIANPASQIVRFNENGAQGGLRVNRSMLIFPGDCMTVTWIVQGAQHVAFQNAITRSSYIFEACGTIPEIEVTFRNGVTKAYSIVPTVLVAPPVTPLIVLAIIAILVWDRLYALGRVSLSLEGYARRLGRGLADVILVPAPLSGPIRRRVLVLGLLLLFTYGVTQWIEFFNNGAVTVDNQDWSEIKAYYTVIGEAFQTGQIPYFTTAPHVTDHFLGNTNVSLMPQIVLIPHLTPGQYALADTLIFYTLGFIGCLLIRRRYRWSLVTFAIFFLLFNFNGHLVSHLAVGHAFWNTLLLFPFFLLFVFEMVEGDQPRRAALKIGLVLFVVALGAGTHQFVWAVLTLLALALFNRRLFAPSLIAIVTGGLLAAFRYFPIAVSYGGYSVGFTGGYPTPLSLLDSMAVFHYQFDLETYNHLSIFYQLYHNARYWEYDLYVGIIGLAFIGVFGVLRHFRPELNARDLSYRALNGPLLVMTLFAFGYTYLPVFRSSIPLLNSERVTSRFIIIPLMILLLLACQRFQRFLPRIDQGLWASLTALATLFLGGMALNEHLSQWRIVNISRDWPFGPSFSADYHLLPLSERALSANDQTYLYALAAGALISLVAFAVWVWLYRRWREPPPPVIVMGDEDALTPGPR